MSAIALVDCNSFFCSCEIVFRPDLEGKAVIVLSNNDGCVVSRTNQAKVLGIKMGQPFYQIKDLVKRSNVHFFSSNYSLYSDFSSRVMQTLSTFTPELEIYSIDEAFLNLDGFSDLFQYGKLIRNTLYKNVHIPVSVGIAQTKVLAKIAAFLCKRREEMDGVVDLSNPKMHDHALELVPVENIWGIGRQSANKLRLLGIRNAKEFRDFKDESYILKLLNKLGLQIKHELQGINCIPVEVFAKKKKQIISSKTFGVPVYTFEALREAVASYITTAAEKLRKQNSLASTLGVYIKTNPFKDTLQYYNIASISFPAATFDTRKLIAGGSEILKQIYRPGYEYKKAGIILDNLKDKDQLQLNLFEKPDSDLDIKLMQVIDLINKKQGKDCIKLAACGVKQDWAMARNFKSPSYTTRWSEIRKVKC